MSPAFLYRTKTQLPVKMSDKIVHITDWFPTLLNMAGLELPNDIKFDGVDQGIIFKEEDPVAQRNEMIYSIVDKTGMSAHHLKVPNDLKLLHDVAVNGMFIFLN